MEYQLSEKEQTVYDKISTADGPVAMDELTHSEQGCIGKLKQHSYIEIFRNYREKRKLVRLPKLDDSAPVEAPASADTEEEPPR